MGQKSGSPEVTDSGAGKLKRQNNLASKQGKVNKCK